MLSQMKINPDCGYQNRSVRSLQDALVFDGYSIWLAGEYEPLKQAESFTLAFELAFYGASGRGDGIFSCWDSAQNQGMFIKITQDEHIRAGLGLGKQQIVFESINAHPIRGRWNRILIIFRHREGWCDLVINGVLSNRVQFPRFETIVWPDLPIYIGRYADGQTQGIKPQMGCFWGLIRKADFLDHALTVEEALKQSCDGRGQELPAYQPDRSVYRADADRPRYHLIEPEKWMNEPHAPFYFQGYYHIFYQANLHAPVWDHIQWGHLISTDMVHWEDLPLALETDPDGYDRMGCWSGSALVDHRGVPRIYYTAGDERRFPNQAVAMAEAANWKQDGRLTVWRKYPRLIQEQDTGWLGEFRDPFVWRENGTYFMLVGTGDACNGGGNAALYSSEDGIQWQSHGMLLDYDFTVNQEVGHVWELPVLLPLKNPEGETACHILLLCACQIEGDVVEVYYFIGKWDPSARTFTRRMDKAGLLDLGYGTFTGPSGFVTPDERSIIFTIAQGKRKFADEYYAGWAHNGGLPLSLWWEDGLRLDPIEELHSCRGRKLLDLQDSEVQQADQELRRLSGNRFLLHIKAEGRRLAVITENDKERITVIYDRDEKRFYAINSDNAVISRYRGEIDQVDIGEDPVELTYYLDHSMIEVYLNHRKAMTLRNYAGSGTRRLGLEHTDGKILEMTAWEMNSAYKEE